MKKIKYYFLAALLVLGILPVTAQAGSYSDVYEYDSYYGAVERLGALGVVSGYGDGSFQPSNILTRAEFSKMIVCALDKETAAKSNAGISKFYDVEQNSWQVPYISYISQNGIVVGYADGSFQPNKPITYAEALTVLCRILQYTETDVGYYWPNNYMDRAAALGITEDMQYTANDPINRASAAILIDRALFSDINGKADTSLLESNGYTVLEDCFIIASRNEDSSLSQNQIRTSEGVYQMSNTALTAEVGKIGTLLLDGGKKAKQFTAEPLESLDTVVTRVGSDNTIEYLLPNGSKESYNFDNTFTTYVNYNKTTFSAAKNSIAVDTDITLYGPQSGNWTFAVVGVSQNSIKPVMAGTDFTGDEDVLGTTQITKENLKIYRNGKSVSLGDIEAYDVIYYNTKTNTMDVYTKKVTGIYYEAKPNKTYVTSVVVGGKEYTIGTDDATDRLDAGTGSFAIGDKVTLLLGKNDEVAFAVNMSGFNAFDYGVVLSTGTQIAQSGDNEGKSEIIAKIFMPDGNTYEYVTDKDYDDYIGDLVQLTYSNGVVSMKKASNSKAYGEIDKTNRTVGGVAVLEDVVILQRSGDADDANMSVSVLNFDTLDVSEIPENKLINSISTNGFGDIGLLYVQDLSGSYNYGILQNRSDEVRGDSYSGTYKIYTDGALESYQNSIQQNISVGTPVYYKVSNGQINELYGMTLVGSGATIAAIDGTRVKVGSKVYSMWDMVQIVDVSDYENYKTLTIDELANLDTTSVKLYADKAVDKGGIVRAITVIPAK